MLWHAYKTNENNVTFTTHVCIGQLNFLYNQILLKIQFNERLLVCERLLFESNSSLKKIYKQLQNSFFRQRSLNLLVVVGDKSIEEDRKKILKLFSFLQFCIRC